jgi:predicted Zn-ribbon and HTH transcriptional regulator
LVIKEKLVTVFECNVCDYEWTSKKYDKDNPPLYCSKCKSAAWDRDNTTVTMVPGGKFIGKEKKKGRTKQI